MVNLVDLPTEILGMIVDELNSDLEGNDLDHQHQTYIFRNQARRRHLARLAGTCRRFYDIANPILWKYNWRRAVLSSVEYGRHAIIEFLADNQDKLRLEGLKGCVNCFDYQFHEAEYEGLDVYNEDTHYQSLKIYDVEYGSPAPIFPAIFAAITGKTISTNPDPAATIKHLISKGQASPYTPSLNFCCCDNSPARRPDGSVSVLHAILCGEAGSDVQSVTSLSEWEPRYGIVYRMLRDIPDFDLTRAYWGRGLLYELIHEGLNCGGASEHTSDIVHLLITRYDLDVNGDSQGETTFRPLHEAVSRYRSHIDHSWTRQPRHPEYLFDTISHLLHYGADPSLTHPTYGHNPICHGEYSWRRPFTAMGAFLRLWGQRNDPSRFNERYKGVPSWRPNESQRTWNWQRLSSLLLSNGARCRFDGNWESPGSFDFACFMDALDGACAERDDAMLRLLVDDLAPVLHQEGAFVPRLWGAWEEVRGSFQGTHRPRSFDGENTRAEWWTTQGVEANWATYLAESSKGWEKWQTEGWVEGVSLLSKLPFAVDDSVVAVGS
ncbi:hypothetical protein B0T20DRAFT_111029 [Sordaria brevicollis]|uniref:F-box domain-containing protein n=1 Tax=Sordaria brevicollis TaxID=83679 RepID=A0AAE0NRF6_SORBR|nr:hypothetical protein B0T20DRAFT_111029 [Sordaria brevicollis]